MWQMDASMEKKFKNGWSIFAKAQNLLNTSLIRYYHANDRNANLQNVRKYDGGVVEREEKNGISLNVGVRWKITFLAAGADEPGWMLLMWLMG